MEIYFVLFVLKGQSPIRCGEVSAKISLFAYQFRLVLSELVVVSLKCQGPTRIAQLPCIVQSMKWSRKFEATFRIVPKEALKNSK